MNYIKIYEKIIDKADSQNRKKTKEGQIYENHHIIPKSVGGLNNKGNLVLLTPKEHYICHKLLVEIYKKTPFCNKMYYAMWCLINGNGNQKRYSPSSRIYDNFKNKLRLIGLPERLNNRKPILQFTLSGEFIQRYDSVKTASKNLGIKSSGIENCGRGMSKSSGGFIWKYENNINGEEIKPIIYEKSGRKKGGIPWNKGVKFLLGCNSSTKKVYQYNLKGYLIKEWGCISVASNELNINRGGIENCSLGKSKSSGGFIWRYHQFDKIDEICVEKSGRKKGSIPWNKKK
jgi:hypothetical protein